MSLQTHTHPHRWSGFMSAGGSRRPTLEAETCHTHTSAPEDLEAQSTKQAGRQVGGATDRQSDRRADSQTGQAGTQVSQLPGSAAGVDIKMAPPPVPKPRARYMRDSINTGNFLDNDQMPPEPDSINGVHQSIDEEAPPPPSPSGGAQRFPTFSGITDMIATSIPSMSGVIASIKGNNPSAPPPPGPSAPPSVDSMASSIATHIPSLALTANVIAEPATAPPEPTSTTAPPPGAPSLDSIVGSFAGIPSLAGMVNSVVNPNGGTNGASVTPSAPPPAVGKAHPPALLNIGAGNQTDVGALSQLVLSALDPNAAVTLPSLEGASEPVEEVSSPSPNTSKEESPYLTMLSSWVDQEEPDSESSNEEEDTGTNSASSGTNGQMKADSSNTNNSSQASRPVPARPAPPPPRPVGPSGKEGKPLKQKTPRAATIRVSRKKGSGGSTTPKSAVSRSSWLDVWKGFRHNVLWATLDGQLMSLWKKRTDRFSEVLFHVSSITNVKKQDKKRFSIYFKKKHYDFMAHSDEIQDDWVTSLLDSRGQQAPTAPELHGQITIKDPRSRVYAAVWGHDLWIYPNKEGFQLGIASYSVPLNVATVKTTGKHSFSLITPYKTFNMSVDSSKDLSTWLAGLSSSISSALSCSQVAGRLWENPFNKVCADCGAANPEWASVNLLLVICQNCAGHHRSLGSSVSKVRSLKMDNKVWTEPLVQLFVTYGNRLANLVWAQAVPAAEQLHPEASDGERAKFIQDKYCRGRYRRVHALTSSPSLMNQRLREVVCGDDIEETMFLICSGAKVCQIEPQVPSPILLAEKAGQAMQTELLRLNEYTEVPAYLPQSDSRRADSTPSGEEEEELHGKLEDDRFLFSLENDSAACDVLDLREVRSVFIKDQGSQWSFEMVTLADQLICAADNEEDLLTHLHHILKVILPGGVSYAEVGGASAVSKVCIVDVGGASHHSDAWLLLWEGGVSVHPVHKQQQQTLAAELSALSRHEVDKSKNTITLETGGRCVSLRFEEIYSCQTWFGHLQRALSNPSATHAPPTANHIKAEPLYPVITTKFAGSVPPAVERCISHIQKHGLKVEGVYRRCGVATKVSRLVEALTTASGSAPLESDEQGVLDAASALKQYVRQQESLFLEKNKKEWVQAAVISDERSRFSAYRRLLQQLPDDNRATLSALFGHFYLIQMFSRENKMSAQNLALVLVPSLFQCLSQDLVRLTREFIVHHSLLFLTPEEDESEAEEQITVF